MIMVLYININIFNILFVILKFLIIFVYVLYLNIMIMKTFKIQFLHTDNSNREITIDAFDEERAKLRFEVIEV